MSSRLQALKASEFDPLTAPLYTPMFFRYSFDRHDKRRAGMLVRAALGQRVMISVEPTGDTDSTRVESQALSQLRPDQTIIFERWFGEGEALTFSA